MHRGLIAANTAVQDVVMEVTDVDVVSTAPKTLQQSMLEQSVATGTNMSAVNQLHKANIEYNNIANWHMQNIICKAMVPLSSHYSELAKDLRSLDATIPWACVVLKFECSVPSSLHDFSVCLPPRCDAAACTQFTLPYRANGDDASIWM